MLFLQITSENSALRATITAERHDWSDERSAAHALAAQHAAEMYVSLQSPSQLTHRSSLLRAELNSRAALHSDEYPLLQRRLVDLESGKQCEPSARYDDFSLTAADSGNRRPRRTRSLVRLRSRSSREICTILITLMADFNVVSKCAPNLTLQCRHSLCCAFNTTSASSS